MPKKEALRKQAAGFIETMDCLPVPRLPEGPNWTYEILCCRPHKISYVAQRFMWRSLQGMRKGGRFGVHKRHITFGSETAKELHDARVRAPHLLLAPCSACIYLDTVVLLSNENPPSIPPHPRWLRFRDPSFVEKSVANSHYGCERYTTAIRGRDPYQYPPHLA